MKLYSSVNIISLPCSFRVRACPRTTLHALAKLKAIYVPRKQTTLTAKQLENTKILQRYEKSRNYTKNLYILLHAKVYAEAIVIVFDLSRCRF